MIKEAIVKIVNKGDLTYEEAYTVMNEIMGGQTTPTQNAAFLAALSTKSARAETTDEIAGCAAAMRGHAVKVETGMELFEIVGTGGDNAGSFNISTTAALVAAAGGMKVAKHGNRAASSLCGTADCLEALGGQYPPESRQVCGVAPSGGGTHRQRKGCRRAGAADRGQQRPGGGGMTILDQLADHARERGGGIQERCLSERSVLAGVFSLPKRRFWI